MIYRQAHARDLPPMCLPVTVHTQCQLVKRFEKQINGLNIGIKSYLEVNLETNGVYHAI